MTKQDKREQKIRANRNNVSIEEFESLIRQYGKIEEGSKHPKALINGHYFPYKRTNPVSAYYVDSILGIIDEINQE
jgi:hypothetical protein